MKKRFDFRFTYGLMIFIGLGILNGCEDYLDINKDPNNPTEVPITSLMATSSFRTGNNIQGVGYFSSYFVQHLASPNPASSTDTQEPVPYDNAWFNIYHLLSDLSDLEIAAEEQGATQYVGAAKILKAINLALVIDVWGDIPYSEAFFAQTLTPGYDDDETLYDEVIILLDNGITEISKDNSSFILENDDFIYNGDIDGWIKMAHALKARYLLHLSKTAGYNPQAILDEVDVAFTSSNENADITYFETEVNPWASVAISQANLILDGWISEQLVQAMDGTTFGVVDPRMEFMFGTTDTDTFVGTENGAGRGTADASGDRSTLVEGTYYSSRTSPLLIITYAEQKFIEAEAALDANDLPRAYQAYLDGIAAHMDMVGVDAVDRDTYLAEPSVGVGSANITLDLIMKEKYVATFLHPETWNDARRYDYQYEDMTIPANLNPDLNGNFLRRVVYPDSETSRNGKNVPEITLLDRVWWDVQ